MFAAGPTAPLPSKVLALARALASRDARRACDRVRNEAKQALRRAAKAEKVAARVDKVTDERLCSTCGIRKLPGCFRPDRFVCKDCLGTELYAAIRPSFSPCNLCVAALETVMSC